MEKCIIAGTASKELAEKISSVSGIPQIKMEYKNTKDGRFKCGEFFARYVDKPAEKSYIIQSTISDKDHMELFFLADKAREYSKEVIAVIPYFGYARQHKVKEGEIKSLETVFKLLEASGVDEVLTVDSHFYREEGYCDDYVVPVKNITASNLLVDCTKERYQLKNPLVVSPDKGGSVVARNLGGDSYSKIRDEDKVEVKGEVNASGRDVIVLDDIIDSGNTTHDAIRNVKNEGAKKIASACTHGLYTDPEKAALIHHEVDGMMMTTDTIPHEHWFYVVSVSELIAYEL